MTRTAVLSGLTLALAGCQAGTRTAEQAASPAADTIAVVGVVRVVGADPLTQLVVQPEGGEAIAVVGPLETELRQVVGLEVRVVGAAADPVPPARRALAAQAYEPLAVNGQPVRMGMLEFADGTLYLVAGDERWALVNPTAELRAAAGAKAWVTGESSGRVLRVAAYGIITRSPP